MGKITGFMEWERESPPKRYPKDRLADYREFYLEASVDMLKRQGGRCMDCGIPFCHQGCPLGNMIPDWNDLVYRDRWREAFQKLSATNNFPEFTGRLCPAPCEGACVLAINTDAVSIEEIEKQIIERAFAEGWVVPRPPRSRTGFKVAVVGSGPAGLAAAAQLNSVGHHVTVFEAADRIGGLLRYGIPDFKMEKWVIDRRVEILAREGIEFVTNVNVGVSPTYNELESQYDALLIAIGARRPRDLVVPGRDLEGVHFAMDFLTEQNRTVAGDSLGSAQITAQGKKVIVLGGGDTGSDCLGTSLRQGAESVYQIELLPRPPNDRAISNPWPQWPLVFKTSTSQEEGGKREFSLLTKKLDGEGGRLKALHAVQIEMTPKIGGGFDLVELPGTEIVYPVDLLLLALGFVGPETNALTAQLGVELDARGNIKTSRESYMSSKRGIFSAGDARRGQSLIVWAISEGREAAAEMDRFLRGGVDCWLPTKGQDQPFGGR